MVKKDIWNKSNIKLLGTDYDFAVATIIGTTTWAVKRKRTALNIAEFNESNFIWSKTLESLLGLEADSKLAKSLCTSSAIVKHRRIELGIEKYAPQKYYTSKERDSWASEAIEKIGTMSDYKLACVLNLTVSKVGYKRRCLGIPKYIPPKKSIVSWGNEQLCLLGRQTDKRIADSLGIPHQVVSEKRKELSIPVYSKRYTEKVLDLLDEYTDEEISDMLFLSICRIKPYRNLIR
jgi:hypothetical protein